MNRSHPDLQEDRFSETVNREMTKSGQASKKSIDKNSVDAHGRKGKADSPDVPEHHSDPLGALARLRIPRKLELQKLLKAWIEARREGSRIPISGNLIFRGPRGKLPLS
jgi:hypothetical protein